MEELATAICARLSATVPGALLPVRVPLDEALIPAASESFARFSEAYAKRVEQSERAREHDVDVCDASASCMYGATGASAPCVRDASASVVPVEDASASPVAVVPVEDASASPVAVVPVEDASASPVAVAPVDAEVMPAPVDACMRARDAWASMVGACAPGASAPCIRDACASCTSRPECHDGPEGHVVCAARDGPECHHACTRDRPECHHACARDRPECHEVAFCVACVDEPSGHVAHPREVQETLSEKGRTVFTGNYAVRTDLERHYQRKLAGYARMMILTAQDFIELFCLEDERGFLTNVAKKCVIRINDAVRKWVKILGKISTHKRLTEIADMIVEQPKGAVVYARVNLKNQDMYIGETIDFHQRTTQHFVATCRHGYNAVRPYGTKSKSPGGYSK